MKIREERNQHQQQARVGIGVMILKGGNVLLGLRTGSHGAGEWAFPGGHLEYMESFEDCAKRETREECGLEIQNIRFQLLANLRQYEPKHYVHVGLIADWKSGEPIVLEREKCREWKWYGINELPELLSLAVWHRSIQNGEELFPRLNHGS
jgi:8-oxo-dGTP diphosphatase